MAFQRNEFVWSSHLYLPLSGLILSLSKQAISYLRYFAAIFDPLQKPILDNLPFDLQNSHLWKLTRRNDRQEGIMPQNVCHLICGISADATKTTKTSPLAPDLIAHHLEKPRKYASLL
jgi:hypothetical protein